MIKKTIKIPLFWKIYIIVVTIVLIGFVVLWSILWTALKKYEQSRPEYAMDKITEQIQLQDTGDFTKYVHTGENAYEGSEALDEAVREYIKNVLCEGAWAYTKKSGEYTNDNPVYQLKKDGQKTDIIIYLEKRSKNEWTIADVSGLSCEGKTYEIIVPENSEVTVDGNKLGTDLRKEIVGDNYMDINDRIYGNNVLLTLNSEINTMVAGIIAGKRDFPGRLHRTRS